MGKFMIATFLLLGWAFYEMSGGADFVPETRPEVVAEAEEVTPTPAPTVTRAVATPLVQIRAEAPAPTPEPAVGTTTDNAADITAAIELASVTDAAETDVTETEAPAAELAEAAPATDVDLRFVGGSRVNMRSGPGTNFGVIDTLDGGTELEVLSVDASGWARVYVPGLAREGYMAERLLTR